MVSLIKCRVCKHAKDRAKRCKHCTVNRIISTWNLVRQIDLEKVDLHKSQVSLRRDRDAALKIHNELYNTVSNEERALLRDREKELTSPKAY